MNNRAIQRATIERDYDRVVKLWQTKLLPLHIPISVRWPSTNAKIREKKMVSTTLTFAYSNDLPRTHTHTLQFEWACQCTSIGMNCGANKQMGKINTDTRIPHTRWCVWHRTCVTDAHHTASAKGLNMFYAPLLSAQCNMQLYMR